jgi:hypothetical protein
MIAPIEVAPASAPGQVKVIRVSQRARKQVVFKLTDDSGKAVDLSQEVENPPAPPPNFSPQPAATGINVRVRMGTVNGGELGGVIGPINGTVLNQEQFRGFVEFILENKVTNCAGVYDMAVERLTVGGQVVDRWPVLMIVEPPAMQLIAGTGPLLIPEIRLALLDLDNGTDGAPFSNLLDDVEFSDIELVFAMRRVVQKWNETPPPVALFSPMNFPYRYRWLQATVGELLLMGAARYRRNRLAYQAGGIAIDDQSKATEYEEVGRLNLKEFDEWMRTEKYRMNMERAWATGI